jgi:hypothetical protein
MAGQPTLSTQKLIHNLLCKAVRSHLAPESRIKYATRMISNWKILAATAWPTFIFATVVIIRQLRRRAQNIRLPVTEKLLRAPGESLRQKIEILDEQLFHRFLIMFIACSAAAFFMIQFFTLASVIPFVVLNILAVGWVMKLLIKRSNYAFGFKRRARGG